jgi:NAD(P)-dependent dehydrogenase (short-subunit alcohol dehydrogenase family)
MKDYFGYKDKVCVVTGAASGMGKATVEVLVDIGAEVYAIDRNPTSLPGVAKEIICDLSKKEEIDKAMAEIPDAIDRFFGVAGVSGLQNTMLDTFKINFLANKYIIQDYLFDRIVEGGALVICTSSGGLGWELEDNKAEYMSLIEPVGYDASLKALEELCVDKEGRVPVPLFYAVSKRAMNYYIATIVEDLAESKKVRINAVLPMGTNTGLVNDFAEFAGGLEEMIEYGTGAAHRLAEPREIGDVMVFLNSDMASFVSGALVSIDFGMLLPQTAGIEHFAFGSPGLITFPIS